MATAPVVDTDSLVDAYVADLNSRIGERKKSKLHRKSHRDYSLSARHVTEDMIRQFAVCQGDANPLWREEEYAKSSPWGQIIGSPMQIISISSATALPPPPHIPGWTLMQAGSTYEMERPLLPGDVIDGEDVWMGITERSKPDRPHRTFILAGERRFTDAAGKYVGKLVQKIFATVPRGGIEATDGPKGPPGRTSPKYTQEQLDEIYGHYDDENAGKLRRGSTPRFWEDVKEGDELGLTIKGPVDELDSASFVAMAGAGLGFADKWMLIKDEIDQSPRNPVTNAYYFNMTWHLADGCAQAMGQPHAISFGTLLEANFGHALSNWAGDHAFVRSMDNKILGVLYLGETAYITGHVVRTYEEDGRGLVEIDLIAKQQDGLPVGSQKAIVQLPHRDRPDEVVRNVLGK